MSIGLSGSLFLFPPSKRTLELLHALATHQKEMIEATLRESGGHVSGPCGAAAKLGIHRSTLESKIAALKIKKYGFKVASTSTTG